MKQLRIFDALRSLEPAFGENGARDQLLISLRSGALPSACERFVGVNPNSYTIGNYPIEAEDFELPASFWGLKCWSEEGETSWEARPSDRWSALSDWREGNFFVSGSHCRGSHRISRRAYGVRLPLDATAGLFRELGVDLGRLWMNGRPPHEFVVDWCASGLRSGRFTSQRDGEEAFALEFPGLSRDHVLRPAFKEARAMIARA